MGMNNEAHRQMNDEDSSKLEKDKTLQNNDNKIIIVKIA